MVISKAFPVRALSGVKIRRRGQWNIHMFGAPDREADTPKYAEIWTDTRASRSEALPPPDPSGRGR
jgi:hypothetical protein